MKPINSRAVLPFLLNLQRMHLLQTCAALAGGAILSLLGPLAVTLSFLLFSMTLILDHGFWGAYWIIAACTLPIFFGIAAWLRGSVLEHAIGDDDSLTGIFVGRFVVKILIVVEIANIGPRLVLWAIGRLRGAMRVRRTKLGRAAQCVAMLAEIESSVSPAKLLFPEESADKLEPLLAFLLFHQIVDLSKRGDRVWLMSTVRTKLQEVS